MAIEYREDDHKPIDLEVYVQTKRRTRCLALATGRGVSVVAAIGIAIHLDSNPHHGSSWLMDARCTD